MNFIESTQKLSTLYKLIKKGNTGNLSEISKRMNICRASAGRYMLKLKELGADIKYDKREHNYYFNNDFNFIIEVKKSPINQQ